MNPTEYFRFVKREKVVGSQGLGMRVTQDVQVLQQWWETSKMVGQPWGEWRDVPLLPEDNRPPRDIPEMDPPEVGRPSSPSEIHDALLRGGGFPIKE